MSYRQFTLDEAYITSLTVHSEWSMYRDRTDLTNEELLKVLQGKDICKSTSSIDHPEFTKLRDELERLGYIKTERSWWNGDRVLKGFKLNEWTFIKGRKFSSASAMECSISCARKYGWKSICN